MNFCIIDPHHREVYVVNAMNLRSAQRSVGLKAVDHGTIYMREDGSGLALVVYEFGLCKFNLKTGELQKQLPMFGYRQGLYAGSCVLYSFGKRGETVSFVPTRQEIETEVIWLPTVDEAEKAIACGLVVRPIRSVNGEVIGRWPDL
jgi:hypothetical protein